MEIKEEKKEQKIDEGENSVYSNASRAKKWIASISIYYCTFTGGIANTFLSPTITDFRNKFHTSTANVSVVFSILTGAYLLGALLGGLFSRPTNRHIISFTAIAVGSISLLTFPHLSSLPLFLVFGGILGLYVGVWDPVQQAWIIDIWRHESPPFILAQHFMYSLGTVVPPLLLAPFLEENDDEDEDATTAKSVKPISTSTEDPGHAGSDLDIPFTVAGIILAVGPLVLIGFYIVFRKMFQQYKKQAAAREKLHDQINEMNNKEKKKFFKFPERRKTILIALSCCCIGVYQGFEMCTMQFLPIFAENSDVNYSESQAAEVLSGCTIAFCISRLVGILLVLKAPPHVIIFGNFILLLAANTLLLFVGDSEKILWAGHILMGIAMSTTFPAYFAYIEKYLFVSDKVIGVILVCAGIVSAIYPIIIGEWIDSNENVLLYVNYFSLTVLYIAFGCIFKMTYFYKEDKAVGASALDSDGKVDENQNM